MSKYECKNCSHASGYHGHTLKQMEKSKYTSPCKVGWCNCKDFELNKTLKETKTL